MQDYHTGKLEEDKDFETIFYTGMRVGDFWPTTIYTVYCGLVSIELGKIVSLLAIIGKLKEIADSFDNSHAQAQFYRLSVVGYYKFRLINQTLEICNEGFGYTIKTGHFTALLVIWCIKSLAHSSKGEMEDARKAFSEAEKIIHDKKIITGYYIMFLQAKAQIELVDLKSCIDHHKPIKKNATLILKTADKLIHLSEKLHSSETEAWRYMASVYWLLKKQNKAFKCYSRSIIAGQKYNCPLELSRTYFEVGKCLHDPHSIKGSLLGMSGSEYLFKAKSMFEEMDLQWDLQEYEKYMEG